MFARRPTYSHIEWNANGKIKSTERTPSSTKSDLEFVYDASGNRIIKIVKPRDGSGVKSELHWTYTYYVRDASGNVMAVYNRTFEFVSGTDYKDKLNCSELHIYGSKRVGTSNVDSLLTFNFGDATFTDNYDNMFGAGSYDPITPITPCTTTCKTNYRRKLGKKQYEVTNHLGNVLATVSDRRLSKDIYSYTNWTSGTKYSYDVNRNMYVQDANGTFQRNGSVVSPSADNKTDWYTADVISYSDYFAFGAQQDGRFGGQYRYTINGQEGEAEICNCSGGYTSAEFWIYNTRLGRRWNIDPVDQISISNYAAFINNPILVTDPLGDCPTCPKNAAQGATYALPVLQPTQAMALTGVDWVDMPAGSSMLYGFDGTEWQLAAFSVNNVAYAWNNTNQWYTAADGTEYDNSWDLDLLNASMKAAMPMADIMGIPYSQNKRLNVITNIGVSFLSSGMDPMSFTVSRMAAGISSLAGDISHGGYRRNQALLGIGISMAGPQLGATTVFAGRFLSTSVQTTFKVGVRVQNFFTGAAPIQGTIARSAFKSPILGFQSKAFGNSAAGSKPGYLNVPKTSPRIGWSGTGAPYSPGEGSYVFRIGYNGGKKFDVFAVPNSWGNKTLSK